jgi:hypothetical protein
MAVPDKGFGQAAQVAQTVEATYNGVSHGSIKEINFTKTDDGKVVASANTPDGKASMSFNGYHSTQEMKNAVNATEKAVNDAIDEKVAEQTYGEFSAEQSETDDPTALPKENDSVGDRAEKNYMDISDDERADNGLGLDDVPVETTTTEEFVVENGEYSLDDGECL